MRFKKLVGIVLVCMIISPIGCPTSFAAHSGSASDPFPISSREDIEKLIECIRVNKDWSNGKHFSLKNSLKLTTTDTFGTCNAGHKFCGIFHGNGHTIKLVGGSLFGYIGEGAIVEDLEITGKGNFAYENAGVIRKCTTTAEADAGIVQNNNGKIEDCQVKGEHTEGATKVGIANSNEGEITRCTVLSDGNQYGLVTQNRPSGKVTNCRVRGLIKGYLSQYAMPSGLVGYNDGLIENCTMNGKMEGSGLVYLVGSTQKSESVVRRSVVGKDATGAHKSMMFGTGYHGQVEHCGYEGWDQEDYCPVK
jgi:hypothetical protein